MRTRDEIMNEWLKKLEEQVRYVADFARERGITEWEQVKEIYGKANPWILAPEARLYYVGWKEENNLY